LHERCGSDEYEARFRFAVDESAYINNEIAHAKWAPKSRIKVKVKEKVVELEGTIFSDEERQAVIVIAENAPGVKEVQDHLFCLDPGLGVSFQE
jgi:hypothetical protein